MAAPEGPVRPVFYDEQRRRWAWILRLAAAAVFLVATALVVFAVSILALPMLPHNALPRVKSAKDVGNPDPVLADHRQAHRQFVLRRDKSKLARQIEADRARSARNRRLAIEGRRGTELTLPRRNPNAPPIVAGFYVNWEETARASLRAHVSEITHFFPQWLRLAHNARGFEDTRIEEDRFDIEPYVRRHNLPIIPVIQNLIPDAPDSEDSQWDTRIVHDIVSKPADRAAFIANLRDYVLAQKWNGINIDFEEVAGSDRGNLVAFMRDLYQSFHRVGLVVTQDVQPDGDGFDMARLAPWNDAVMPMLYDQHSPGDPAGPGSIAGIDWTRGQLKRIFAQVPADKVVLAFGSYAYDWRKGRLDAASVNYQAAVLQAKESLDPDNPALGRIQLDPKTLNPWYRYEDDDGQHVVWMLDATTVYNQWVTARSYHPRGFALWYMGGEDPDIWDVLGRSHIARDADRQVDGGALNVISYQRQSEVDFEGEGELLEVMALPTDGRRSVARDPVSGLITRETYDSMPSGYVVRRYGYKPKSIVLSFDDGPDPRWTPQVLDILKREGVKATFFVVGQQAEAHPNLLARIWEEGHELGNHTFTHPNTASAGHERTLLELTTTQRVIEAITGHTTTLFRPPYAIDVEPRTGGELKPIIQASAYHFISVGEKIDPQDWNTTAVGPNGETGVRRIVDAVWADRNKGNVILLHDAGGDRSATVAALPIIIERLKAAGYHFITVADLRGESRQAMFPPIGGREEVLVGVDKWVFETTYLVQTLLVTLFTLSVVLGVSRQVWMGVLAVLQRRRELRLPAAPPYTLPVTVLIAAYNEEKVIERTVRTVLDGDYPDVEVIVVDDGSRDNTTGVVQAAFGGDPRVTCIHKENGGKASALNLGLEHASGEVVVALDADTLFRPDTISRLVRHFGDQRVGAVSGNVRVGNPGNLLARWQALEYITSQNFDRRAYDLLNCITVVPGAVGAWRREAIAAVGGYTSDTLAEDTDLTWKVRRAGWRIANDGTALAFTEVPETLRNLARQRFRWAFGTLQNLWKHRDALFRHGAFGWIALPSLWLYQILFPAISPIMDATVVWALLAGNFAHVALYYGLMVAIEFVGAGMALWMDRGDWRLLPWLFLQRLAYRQVMYYVILKSFLAAVRGGAVGWNKLERRGTAVVAGEAVVSAPRTKAAK